MRKLFVLFVVVLMSLMPVNTAFGTIVNAEAGGDLPLSAFLPDFANSKNFRFNGTTSTGAIVEVYVNGNSFHNDIADSDGVFEFSRVLLTRNVSNNVTVIATKGDLVSRITKMIQVDDEDPEFVSKDELPKSSFNSIIDFSFELTEECTVTIKRTVDGDTDVDELGDSIKSYNYTINLDDGSNYIEFTATDKAGNSIYFDEYITVDTTPPVIEEHNLDDISPTYSRDITIKGQVSEKSTVRITVNGDKNSEYECSDGKDNDNDGHTDYPNDPGCMSPTGRMEMNTNYNYACSDGKDNDGDGGVDFPDDLGCDNPQDTDETDYNGSITQCNDGVDNDKDGLIDFNPAGGGDWGCSSASDSDESDDPDIGDVHTVSTDDNGKFEKKITLKPQIATNFGTTPSISVTSDVTENTLDFSTTGEENEIELLAVDTAGLPSSPINGLVEYTTCNSGDADFLVVQKDVYPTSLIPDHIFQGLAQVSFSLELDYLGLQQGQQVEVNRITFDTRDISVEDKEEWDMNLFDPNKCVASSNDNINWYVTCNLKRYPADTYRNITKAYDDFEEQQRAKLPVDLIIHYQETIEETGKTRQVITKSQKICYDLDFLLDIRLDPDDIPEELLNKTVNLLNKTIDAIDSILPLITQAKWAVAVGCFGTMAWEYLSSLGDTIACMDVDKSIKTQIDMAVRGTPDYNLLASDKYDAFKSALKLDEGTDIDTCVAERQAIYEKQEFQHWLCDRIFCPAVPSAQKYANEERQGSDSPCSTRFALKSENQLTKVMSNPYGSKEPSMCETDYEQQWKTACPAYDGLKESAALENAKKVGDGAASLGSLVRGIANCDWGKNDANGNATLVVENGHGVVRERSEGEDQFKLAHARSESAVSRDKELGRETKYYSEATMDYSEINDYSESEFSQSPYLGSSGDCANIKPNIMSDLDANFEEDQVTRMVNYSESSGKDSEYLSLYQVSNNNDVPTSYQDCGTGDDVVYYADKNGQFYCQDKTGVISPTKSMIIDAKSDGRGSVSYKARLVDPGNRTGRADCFNSDVISKYNNDQILVDPTSSVINSIRCACLPAIEGYLQSIRNIALAIKNCFESILVTGEYDTGICKAIFTQYLCDFIFDLFGCVVDSFSVPGSQIARDTGDNVGTLFTDLKDAGDRIKDSTSKRYGNTNSFKTLFNERQIIHSLCLAAFGYDWKPDLMNAMSSSSGGISINSTGFVAPATRRFMSSDPVEGSATFMYHIGYFLTAGGPLNWRLELICSSSYDCDPEHFANGKCDCANSNIDGTSGSYNSLGNAYSNTAKSSSIGGRSITVDGGVLQGGDSVGSGGGNPYSVNIGTKGTGDLYIPLDHPVRYDKVRLCWDSNLPEGKSGCAGPYPIRQEGGKSPATCTFSLSLGRFSCGYYSSGTGTAYFNSIDEFRNGATANYDAGESPFGQSEEIQYKLTYSLLSRNDDLAQGSVSQAVGGTDEETQKFITARITDEDGKLLGSVLNTGYPLTGEGSIVFPDSGITPKILVGDGGTDFDLIGKDTVTPETGKVSGVYPSVILKKLAIEVDSEHAFKGSGSGENILVFVYSGDGLKYSIQDSQSVQNPRTNPVQRGTSAVGHWAAENFANSLFKEADFLSGSDEKFKVVGSNTIFKLNTAEKDCTETGVVCIGYFRLSSSKSESLEDRCRDIDQLDWNIVFEIVEDDGYGSASRKQVVAEQGKKTEWSLPLAVTCSDDGTSTGLNRCIEHRPLSSSCDCYGNAYTYKAGKTAVCYNSRINNELQDCPPWDGKGDRPTKGFEAYDSSGNLLDRSSGALCGYEGDKREAVSGDVVKESCNKTCRIGEYIDLTDCTCKVA